MSSHALGLLRVEVVVPVLALCGCTIDGNEAAAADLIHEFRRLGYVACRHPSPYRKETIDAWENAVIP